MPFPRLAALNGLLRSLWEISREFVEAKLLLPEDTELVFSLLSSGIATHRALPLCSELTGSLSAARAVMGVGEASPLLKTAADASRTASSAEQQLLSLLLSQLSAPLTLHVASSPSGQGVRGGALRSKGESDEERTAKERDREKQDAATAAAAAAVVSAAAAAAAAATVCTAPVPSEDEAMRRASVLNANDDVSMGVEDSEAEARVEIGEEDDDEPEDEDEDEGEEDDEGEEGEEGMDDEYDVEPQLSQARRLAEAEAVAEAQAEAEAQLREARESAQKEKEAMAEREALSAEMESRQREAEAKRELSFDRHLHSSREVETDEIDISSQATIGCLQIAINQLLQACFWAREMREGGSEEGRETMQ